MRFVEGEQNGITILLQPVRQPGHRVPSGLGADLERDAGNTGFQTDGEIVEYPGRLPDGAANALDQRYGCREMFREKTNQGDGKFPGLLPRLLRQPSQKHGLAVAARPVQVCQTGTMLTGAKPVHDIQQRALDALAVAHVAGQ